MSERPKTVFISSTFEDLKNIRREIWDILESYDVNILGMEQFGARKASPLTTCLTEVDQSDIFLCLVAFRLGSVDNTSGKSFTQLEYERALEKNKDILIYFADDKDSKISPLLIDHGESWEKLQSFKTVLKERHTIDTFISEEDLSGKIKRKFDEILSRKTEGETDTQDEFEKSKSIIEKFLLLPKTYSGSRVKLNIDIKGKPYPASKQICDSFNFSYGETIGLSVDIKKPEGLLGDIPYLFIEDDNVEEYFKLDGKTNIDIIGKLQFSSRKTENVRANFVSRTVYNVNSGILTVMSPSMMYGDPEVIEADGTILIKLDEILK